LSSPLFSTVLLDSSKLVITHTMAFRPTVIGSKLSAWICQPFCCQRTFSPSRSECPECLRTCLAGLNRPLCAVLPSSSAPVSGILLGALVALDLFRNSLRNFFHFAPATNHCRTIKNPASSAGHMHHLFWCIHAKLDKSLSRARKVPHSRI
jgi:hypothetical protein